MLNGVGREKGGFIDNVDGDRCGWGLVRRAVPPADGAGEDGYQEGQAQRLQGRLEHAFRVMEDECEEAQYRTDTKPDEPGGLDAGDYHGAAGLGHMPGGEGIGEVQAD